MKALQTKLNGSPKVKKGLNQKESVQQGTESEYLFDCLEGGRGEEKMKEREGRGEEKQRERERKERKRREETSKSPLPKSPVPSLRMESVHSYSFDEPTPALSPTSPRRSPGRRKNSRQALMEGDASPTLDANGTVVGRLSHGSLERLIPPEFGTLNLAGGKDRRKRMKVMEEGANEGFKGSPKERGMERRRERGEEEKKMENVENIEEEDARQSDEGQNVDQSQDMEKDSSPQ